MRIEHIDLTFLNLPLVRPEGWVWGRRDSYTVGLVELYLKPNVKGYKTAETIYRLHVEASSEDGKFVGWAGRPIASITRGRARAA